MTDQTTPDGLTRDEAQAVREWAERARDAQVQDATVFHAARVILAVLPKPPTTTAKETPDMTDQTLDDQVRPIVADMRAAMRRVEDDYPDGEFLMDMSGYIKDLEALLPALPTLADMNDEERDASQWMQADVEQQGRAVIILPYGTGGRAVMLDQWGDVTHEDHASVTPRPDLPRLEWPDTGQEPAPAPAPALPDGWRLADHPSNGRVIVTNTTPNIEGRVYYVLPSADPLGFDWLFCDPDELTYIDQEAADATD